MIERTTIGLVGLVAGALAALLLPAPAAAGNLSLHGSYWATDDAGEALGVGARFGFLPVVQVELGASYFEELELEPFAQSDLRFDLEAIPLDAGVRFGFGPAPFYVGGGVSLYLLDSSFGELDEEFGYYARFGFQINKLFFELAWREVEGTVEGLEDLDPDELDDVELVVGEVPVNLSGLVLSVGFRF